ncbi:hypothetical protein [Streptomyces sp. NBC_00388]|uniref:hypothetical protein n=1 Tax=Streptomyces sp. NBC_00388 TaxID=2975735 RepID=UPI002E23F1FD
MADERCEWLDKDTAERLLRGGPVGAVDDHARAQAARLRAALDGAARSAAPSDIGELPGEKAALEAFRLARDGAAGPAGPVRPPAAARWGRPVRFSIAAVVAGCALSGVAVAAGAGMLPSPFGRSEPMPASSVSSAATPRPLLSGSSPATAGSASPRPDSSTPGTGEPTPRTPQAGSGDGGSTGPGDSGAGRPDGRPGAATGQESGAGRQGTPSPSGDHDRSTTGLYRKLAAVCRDYRAGRVGGERRRSLESKAGGAQNVQKFCGRVLGAGGSGDHHVSFTPQAPLSPASPVPSRPAGASPSPKLGSPASSASTSAAARNAAARRENR